MDKYTSNSNWGQCMSYPVAGMKSSLGVQLQVYQHQNNSVVLYVRFRAKVLYVLNKSVEQAVRVRINGVLYPVVIGSLWNN